MCDADDDKEEGGRVDVFCWGEGKRSATEVYRADPRCDLKWVPKNMCIGLHFALLLTSFFGGGNMIQMVCVGVHFDHKLYTFVCIVDKRNMVV